MLQVWQLRSRRIETLAFILLLLYIMTLNPNCCYPLQLPCHLKHQHLRQGSSLLPTLDLLQLQPTPLQTRHTHHTANPTRSTLRRATINTHHLMVTRRATLLRSPTQKHQKDRACTNKEHSQLRHKAKHKCECLSQAIVHILAHSMKLVL